MSLFAQAHSLKAGLKTFGKKGKDEEKKEEKKLNDRTVQEPAEPNDLTTDEKHKAMKILIFLAEKRCGTTKGRACANESIQRSCVPKEEASSLIVTTESGIMTNVMDAEKKETSCEWTFQMHFLRLR